MNRKAFPYTLAFLRVKKELGELLASLLNEDSTKQGDLLERSASPLNQPSTLFLGAKAFLHSTSLAHFWQKYSYGILLLIHSHR